MALRFKNTEITRVYFNGKEENTLEYNGKRYFGKRFELTKKESHGVTLTVKRTSSPNQQAGTGEISAGNGIYYGDVITIEIKAEAGYQEPKLYIDTGSGMEEVSEPYTFTVTGNVSYYGKAEKSWETVWSGSNTVTSMEGFTVPGLDTSEETLQLTATVTFGRWLISQQTGGLMEEATYKRSINRAELPTKAEGLYSSIAFRRQGNQIVFTVREGWQNIKGYYVYEVPVSTEFTEVRSK